MGSHRQSEEHADIAAVQRGPAGDEDIEEEGEELEDESQDEEALRDAEDEQSLATGIQFSPATTAEPDYNTGRARSESIVSSTSIYDRGWGEAPAYEDAIQNVSHADSTFRTSSDTTDRSTDIIRVTTGGSQVPLNTPNTRRDSASGTGAGFRSFVSRLTGRSPASGLAGRYASVGPGLADAEIGQGGAVGASPESFAMTGRSRGFSNASGTSQLTVDSAAPRPSASSGITRLRSHTGVASTNNSLVSLLLHPTISNQSVAEGSMAHRFQLRGRSGSNAASITGDPSSPSASVVNLAISPPLPGSVIRSAYNQPRAGFSTEQLKFLSSTESLGKYGANFGPDDASSGLGPSSHLYTTRSRSGSASSVGVRPGLGTNSHRRAQSSGSILANDNDGLPSFEDLVTEEAVAEEQRRASVSRTHASDPAVSQAQSLEEAVPDPQRSTSTHNDQPQLSALQLPRALPNFDLEVVPPTPITEENRRSFLNGQSVA
ncbi:hypothetical protein QFC20_001858 [Naganishia adeliensis]|uniref:Uncharacterized protein n=1 Tax=Naganishia adeliensis TaxID=92952 RepID=A0ACC2WSJ6_9TREE|nr:hypothetical protein QFC20_001858 [Naganishia adeliensis]